MTRGGQGLLLVSMTFYSPAKKDERDDHILPNSTVADTF